MVGGSEDDTSDVEIQKPDAPETEEPTTDLLDVAPPVGGIVLTLPDDGSDIIGTDGNDTLTLAYDDESYSRDVGDIQLGDGDELVDIVLHGAHIEGGLGNDTITSLGEDQRVSGGDGDDLIETNGQSYAYGDAGNDTLISSDGEDLWGGEGDDVLSLGLMIFMDSSGVRMGKKCPCLMLPERALALSLQALTLVKIPLWYRSTTRMGTKTAT